MKNRVLLTDEKNCARVNANVREIVLLYRIKILHSNNFDGY